MGTITNVEKHILKATETVRRDRSVMWRLKENVEVDESFKIAEIALENLATKIENATRV